MGRRLTPHESKINKLLRDRQRQEYLQAWADKHSIVCFRCGSDRNKWAASGVSRNYGKWIVCESCVQAREKEKRSNRAQTELDLQDGSTEGR